MSAARSESVRAGDLSPVRGFDDRRRPGARSVRTAVPAATVARLPLYLRALTSLLDGGTTTVSSEALATAAGVTGAKVRKDLSQLGSYGTRGVGYDVASLADEISRELGLTSHRCVVLVGVGNLGRALAGYGGFTARGFRVAGLLDVDPGVLGETVGGVEVRPLDELETVIARRRHADRRHRHARGRRAVGLRPARRLRDPQHPQLRARGADRPRRTSNSGRSTSRSSSRSCPSTRRVARRLAPTGRRTPLPAPPEQVLVR